MHCIFLARKSAQFSSPVIAATSEGQPAISSQLIDNLNASTHLRALLTDLFLIGEILSTQRAGEAEHELG
jgi:hypothetical protein